jgi:uncharacterized protein (TIGR03000 family)
MFRNTRLQMVVVVAAGAIGGWLAGSGRLQSLPRAEAAPQAPTTIAPATGPCCDGADRGATLAKADAIPSTLVAQLPTQAAAVALALAPGQADEVILFEILVPADAALEIDGFNTQSSGEDRHFQTPAVPAGKHYTYTVKATSKGKEVTKKLSLSHGGVQHPRPPAGIPGRRARADDVAHPDYGQADCDPAQHPVHHGRRHRLDAAELLPPRPDGRRDAQHRPNRK